MEHTPDADERANVRYYHQTGKGRWSGTFTFELTDREAFWNDRIGLVNRFLVLLMVFVMNRFERASIDSNVQVEPDTAPAGAATNEVRITLWRITLYLLRERYYLHPDGRGVTVDARERFGPVPFLFRSRKAHPAEILEGGTRATYYIPLLGTDWIGRYHVDESGEEIEAELTCDWAVTTEDIARVE